MTPRTFPSVKEAPTIWPEPTKELFKMNIAPIAKRPMSCFTLERRLAQYFNREICLRNAPALMLQPPGSGM